MLGVSQLLRGFGPSVIGTTPVVDVVDNANGTATATIANGDAGAVNTVYTRRITGGFKTGLWTSSGTLTGNGIVPLTLTAGHYFAQVRTNTGAVSSLVYFTVTDGTAPIEKTILEAVRARLILLDLSGIADANVLVFVEKPPTIRDLATRPAIAIYSPKREFPLDQAVNSHDGISYSVVVCAIDTIDITTEITDGPVRALWIEQIARGFSRQLLTGATTVYDCVVSPLDTPVRSNWQTDNLWVSGHVLKFTSREPRGM